MEFDDGRYYASRGETDQFYFYENRLSNLTKDDLKIEVQDKNIVFIDGLLDKTKYGFTRSIRVPPNGKVDEARAVIRHGNLTITVPKAEGKVPEGNPRIIEIDT
ncbi:hypothetical protein M569_11465 [Genlisea aurea]|uniref:SHSP domain-containing protein n=1 Tax=Genlisea aurea TaxID=192259 RepID=S8C900_9LAMI|nr:hypothetical protein M569_11465 [Genlisea aurea]